MVRHVLAMWLVGITAVTSGCSVLTAERSDEPCADWKECRPSQRPRPASSTVKPPQQGKPVDVSRYKAVVFTDPKRRFFCRLSAEMATCSVPDSVGKPAAVPLQRNCELDDVNGVRVKTNAYLTCTRDLISTKLDSESDEIKWFAKSPFAAKFRKDAFLKGRAVLADGYALKHGNYQCSVIGEQLSCIRGSGRAWFVMAPGGAVRTRLSTLPGVR